MAYINFYCRESKASKKNGLAPVEFEIRINNRRTFIQTPKRVSPAEFKEAMASANFNHIKAYCDGIRRQINEFEGELALMGTPLTPHNLRECMKNGGTRKVYTLNDLFVNFLDYHNKRMKKGLITKDTYNRYVKSTEFFLQYSKLKKTASCETVTLEHLQIMQTELLGIMDKATAVNYLQKIKSCFKWGFETGKVSNNPAFLLKIEKKQKDTILYLTQEEVMRIINHKWHTERLQRVADYFIFACYSGLAIGDFEALERGDFKISKGDIQNQENKNLRTQEKSSNLIYIEKERVKTKVKFCTVLLGEAERIAKKYNYNFNIIRGQKINEYLKEIADLCEIDKNLTFHMARHTYATFLINHRNPTIDKETIMKVMGWKKEEQYRHYAKILNETVFIDLEPLRKELQIDEPEPKNPKKPKFTFVDRSKQ